MSKMATQQEVIKAFMRSLDNSTKSGADALDEAVKSCSGGKFSSMQNLIDCFIRDVGKYGGTYTYDTTTRDFLEKYCGIILYNQDTGAITGSDAGTSKVKTNQSIVAESGAVKSFPSGGQTTINGLTIHWPDKAKLSSDQRAITDRIYTWWASGALNLIQESLGMSFQEAGATVKDINIEFYNKANDNILASVESTHSWFTGKTKTLTLNINMHYYSNFDRNDVNGAPSGDNTSLYFDRTLAHEFVHAVMAANIDNFDKLPIFVTEGLAELVHGIDDVRTYELRTLATTGRVEELKKMFSIRGTYYNYGSASYAGGYMLFRYLAKQASASTASTNKLPSGVTYNAAKNAVTIASPFSGTWDAKDYAATVRTVDASKANKAVIIKAGKYNNTIKAGTSGSNIYGQGGNDTIYGGAGKDVFWYGSGDGADTIYNFQSGKDILRFYNKAALSGVTTSGTNVVLKSGTGSVKLAGKANQRVDITDNAGKNAIYYFGCQDEANTFVYGANYRYYGSTKNKDILRVNTGATVSLASTALYHDIEELDATRSTVAVKLTGGAKNAVLRGSVKNDTLTAGTGGAQLYGGKGNDALYGGKGKDKFYWGTGLGNDIVYNYESNRDIIAFQVGSLTSGKVSGNDVVLTSNTGNTITLKNAIGKVIVTADVSGKLDRKTYNQPGVAYNANKTAVTIKAPFSGTWDIKNYASTVRTIDASPETNNITIKAGSYNSTIKAGKNGSNIYGQGGNDTIYGGAGKDVFWYGTGDGADTINNFQSGKDVLRFYNKAQLNGVTTSGTNVVVKSGTGSVKLIGKANQRVDITDVNGKNAAYYFCRQDKANTFVYGANQRYYGSAKYKDTLQVNTGATVSLGNTALYRDIDALDATRSKVAVKLTGGAKAAALYGSAQHDTLTAGSGGATLVGGKGNDTLYGGNGVDKFYWGANLGNDIIHNYTSGKDIVVFSAGSLKSGKVSGQDVILTSNTGNTLTLKKAAGKAITIQGTDGKQVKKTYNILTTTSLPAGVTYNSQTMTVKLSKGMVTDFSLAGKDVVLKSTVGDIRIVDAKDKILSVVNGNGVKATYKVAGNIPSGNGESYNSNKTEVIFGREAARHMHATLYLSDYPATVKTMNASATNADYCTLKGDKGDDTLIAGSGNMNLSGGDGNDKLYGGAGENMFYWSKSYGNDIVYNYTKNQDKIYLYNGCIESYTVSGNDVILKSGKATLTVKDTKPGDIAVYNDNERWMDTYWYDKKLPAGVTYNKVNSSFVINKGYSTLKFDISTYPTIAKNIDARNSSGIYGWGMTLYGDERDNIIYASNHGDSIHTGRGNDTVYFGDGQDTLYWNDSGNKVIYNYKEQDRIQSWNNYTAYTSGRDVVLKSGNSTLTLKNTKMSDVTISHFFYNYPVSNGKSSMSYINDVMGITGKAQSSSLMPISTKADNKTMMVSQQIVSAQAEKNKLQH